MRHSRSFADVAKPSKTETDLPDPAAELRMAETLRNPVFGWGAVGRILEASLALAPCEAESVVISREAACFLNGAAAALTALAADKQPDEALRSVTRALGLSRPGWNAFGDRVKRLNALQEARWYQEGKNAGISSKESLALARDIFGEREERHQRRVIAEGQRVLRALDGKT
jgi:hypothetical protein